MSALHREWVNDVADQGYNFNGFHIQPHMLAALKRYAEHGIEPGSFLTAVICNNLKDAVGRADSVNLRNLPAFVGWLYNEAPGACWGSEQIMQKWINDKAKALQQEIKP